MAECNSYCKFYGKPTTYDCPVGKCPLTSPVSSSIILKRDKSVYYTDEKECFQTFCNSLNKIIDLSEPCP